MLKNIFMVRHGETDWNLQERVQGWSDIPLNETGLKQANDVAKKIQNFSIGAIYASDLQRTKKTAEIIDSFLHIGYKTNKNLRETNFGDAEGLTRYEKETKFADIMKQINDKDNPKRDDVKIPNGESRNEVISRFHQGVYEICTQENADNILLCIHRSLINTLLLLYRGEMAEIDNCAVIKSVFDTKTKTFLNIDLLKL